MLHEKIYDLYWVENKPDMNIYATYYPFGINEIKKCNKIDGAEKDKSRFKIQNFMCMAVYG
jgi:hypothetical protein